MRIPVLRSIRARLTLLVSLIALGAIAGVYLFVVPTLEHRLTDETLRQLGADARTSGAALAATVGSSLRASEVTARVRRASASASVRVTLLRVGRIGGRLRTEVVADSAALSTPGDLQFASALEAAATRRTVLATESAGTGRWGEAARPLLRGGRPAAVAVLSAPLSAVQQDVAVVRRRFLVAGGIAFGLAVLAGLAVATLLARRVRRLDRAAEGLAGGDFSRPIPVESSDELGQLALTFNAMRDQLAALETARKQFIATASHELRTPIFSLGGFVELLEDEEVDEEDRRRFVAQLGEQVERLRKLATDLLDLSKLESGSLELRPEAVDLAELARGVAAEFEPALATRDAHLVLRLGTGPPDAVCDPVRVAQVLRILIDNALTHTPPGTEVIVTAGRHDGRARLAVRDDGPGIRRADQAQVFEPFFTSDGTRGSGLGLAIASELAGYMHGTLALDAQPGHTAFTLEVPAA